MKWIKYSGLWAGVIINPFHWRFGWERNNDIVFENCIFVGPFWLRIIIDDGKW